MKSAFRIVKFVLIQVLVLFVIMEVGLRILRPLNENVRVLLHLPSVTTGFDSLQTVQDLLETTIIGYRPCEPIAGFVRNSRGFRTHEYSATKQAGTLRIVLIGDSFTFSCGGIPFSDSWQTVLERRLGAQRTGRVELLSLAAPGVGPLFQRRLWQIEGARIEPDVLLLQLFIGNDFTDHYDIDFRPGSTTALARWSYTVRFARNASRVLAARDGGDPEAARLTAEPRSAGELRCGYELPEYRDAFAGRKPFMTRDRLIKIESDRARLCEASQAESFAELLERMKAILRDLREDVEATGVEMRVVIIPDRFQVNPEDRQAVLERLAMSDDLFDWDKPQRELNEFFRREGIEHLDLLPSFREASGTEQLYDTGNTHWNLRGNEFAAERIAEWLERTLPARLR